MVQGAGPDEMTDDWHCLELARGGDEHAWRILFERYYPMLVRMASYITGSLEAARDLAQESFVRLLEAKVSHHDGSFKSYLSTIAYRLALKERKRNNLDTRLDPALIADASPTPLELAIQEETDVIIIRVIQSLSDEHREILALRYVGEHSYEEISRITGVPIGTVKSRIFYAVKFCQEKLKYQGVFK
jgi:RNA polymerase sigma-70 factor (ECF subfamily)